MYPAGTQRCINIEMWLNIGHDVVEIRLLSQAFQCYQRKQENSISKGIHSLIPNISCGELVYLLLCDKFDQLHKSCIIIILHTSDSVSKDNVKEPSGLGVPHRLLVCCVEVVCSCFSLLSVSNDIQSEPLKSGVFVEQIQATYSPIPKRFLLFHYKCHNHYTTFIITVACCETTF